MSQLATICRNIDETRALLAQHDRALLEFPHRVTEIAPNVRSLTKLLGQFEREFEVAARSLSEDVCRYRLFSVDKNPTMPEFAEILLGFQSLVSLAYHAIDRKEPLARRARVSAASATRSTFGFAYSFAGSLGAVLTIPNEEMIGELDSALDETIGTVFSIAAARRSDEIKQFASRLGIPVIKAAFRWAECHASHALGAEIQWRRAEVVRSKAFVQHQEFGELSAAICGTSEETAEELKVAGSLIGADVKSRSFHFLSQDGHDIRGRFADAIDQKQTAIVPYRYTATIRKAHAINYATDEETTSFFLLHLEP